MDTTTENRLQIINHDQQLSEVVDAALAAVYNPITRRLYGAHIRRYLTSHRTVSRDAVAGYIRGLSEEHGPSSANQALSAVKRLAGELHARGHITDQQLAGIDSVPAITVRGTRTGNWLTIAQTKRLLALPGRSTLPQLRDTLVLGLLVGCGLRRSEATGLCWGHLKFRDHRLCICDLVGKGGRIRTVPVPEWLERDLWEWRTLIRTTYKLLKLSDPALVDSRVLLSIKEGGGMGTYLSPAGIWWVVKGYAIKLGLPDLAPHDLRRTYARLARDGGAELEQVQLTLGHSSVQTTERYVGAKLQTGRGLAAGDRLGL